MKYYEKTTTELPALSDVLPHFSIFEGVRVHFQFSGVSGIAGLSRCACL